MDSVNPNTKLYLQYGITILVILILAAAWWFGKVPAEMALPIITGLVGVWLPGPLSASIPHGMSVVPSDTVKIDPSAIARSMSLPGRHYTRNVYHPVPVKELTDVRDPE